MGNNGGNQVMALLSKKQTSNMDWWAGWDGWELAGEYVYGTI